MATSINTFRSKYTEYREQVEKTKNPSSKDFSQSLQNSQSAKGISNPNSAAEASQAAKSEIDKKQNDLVQEKKEQEVSSSSLIQENPLQNNNATANQNIQSVASADLASSELSPKIAEFSDHIKAAAAKYNLDPALVAGFIWQESRANPQAKSHCGAMGLMQLMPGTAANLGVKDPWDPQQNIMGGAKYIRQMLDKFDGKVELAVAAYNAGPGNVIKHGYKIPPFKETQDYVPNVLNYASNFKASGLFDESDTTMRA